MIEPKNFDCLLKPTKLLLLELMDTAPFLHNYVFVGGLALAIHLCHRKSEDLEIRIFSRDEKKQHDMRLHYINDKIKFW